MATLDLRNDKKMFVQARENKTRSFTITGNIGSPVLTGAAATLRIELKEVLVAALAIGSGLIITAANKMVVSLPGLPAGLYDYILEIIPVTGELIVLSGLIESTNE